MMGERGTELLQVILEKKMGGISDVPRRAVGAAGGRGLIRLLGATQLLLALVEGQKAVTVGPGFEI